MDTQELNVIAEKLSAFVDKINDEIEKSGIENHDLKDFELHFANGKCRKFCFKTPIGEICICL